MAQRQTVVFMSSRKPMGCFWAILAVSDNVLSGGRRILLAKMFLLDNGSRGCSASAAVLGQYTGLTERTVDKYRREFHARGLLYPVHGTRGWHLALPSGLPADRADVPEIQVYARRIESQIGATESTPPGAANHTPRCPEDGPENPPGGVDSVPRDRAADPTGLMSTQETHEKALKSASSLRNENCTQEQEEERARGDGELTDTQIIAAKRRAWREAARQVAK
jgi:hypothetical protein